MYEVDVAGSKFDGQTLMKVDFLHAIAMTKLMYICAWVVAPTCKPETTMISNCPKLCYSIVSRILISRKRLQKVFHSTACHVSCSAW